MNTRDVALRSLRKPVRASLIDTIRRLTRRGWSEADAEVLSCKDCRERWYSPSNLKDGQSLRGWLVTFQYSASGRQYQGLLVSDEELIEGEKFAIQYNPARPDQNDSISIKLDWLSRRMVTAYLLMFFGLLVTLAICGLSLRR